MITIENVNEALSCYRQHENATINSKFVKNLQAGKMNIFTFITYNNKSENVSYMFTYVILIKVGHTSHVTITVPLRVVSPCDLR